MKSQSISDVDVLVEYKKLEEFCGLLGLTLHLASDDFVYNNTLSNSTDYKDMIFITKKFSKTKDLAADIKRNFLYKTKSLDSVRTFLELYKK